jgi:hypothetical protein
MDANAGSRTRIGVLCLTGERCRLARVFGDVVAFVNLLDQRVADSGSGPGHATSTSGEFFVHRTEIFEGLRPEAR